MKKYPKEDISVVWNPKLCTHAGFCARQLSSVFKPKERPWINTDNATKEEIIAQVEKCPSGALSIESHS